MPRSWSASQMSTSNAGTFAELLNETESRAENAPYGSGARWRLRALVRHFRALAACKSPADSGAILREILRIEDRVLSVPRSGFPISAEVWPYLASRFGISIQLKDDSL